MATWRAGHRNVYELNEWQKADEFATLLHDVCRELDLGRDQEWLIELLTQAGRLVREALQEGWNREYLAEFILGICEALTFLGLVDYYLVFLRHEGYLTVERADEVEARLSELQEALSSLAGGLREALRSRHEDPLSSSPWSRNSSAR
jgi:four helix bundle protein